MTHVIKYIISNFTPQHNEFARLDAVANICSQITAGHSLIYGTDFVIDEIGIDETGHQWLTLSFKREEVAMLVRLKGLQTITGNYT